MRDTTVYDRKSLSGLNARVGMLRSRNGSPCLRVGYKGYAVGTLPSETDEKEIIFFINARIETAAEQSYYDALIRRQA